MWVYEKWNFANMNQEMSVHALLLSTTKEQEAELCRGRSSAAGDQLQQRERGSYMKMEDYTRCSASLIKRLKKISSRLRFSLFYIPLVLHFINRRNVTWECHSGQKSVNVRRLRQHWGLPLQPGPNQSDVCTAAVLRLCAHVHLSARLMDLQEMALGIYYHV